MFFGKKKTNNPAKAPGFYEAPAAKRFAAFTYIIVTTGMTTGSRPSTLRKKRRKAERILS